MEMKFKIAIYLVEQSGKVSDAFDKMLADRAALRQSWLDWAREYMPENAKMLQYGNGYIAGFKFEPPRPGWRKPDKNGCSMPLKNNPLRATMPQDKGYKDAREYFEEAGIDVPLDVQVFNADGQLVRSHGIGHWFNPIQFVCTGADADGKRLRAVVLPDYAAELGETQLKLQAGETMLPAADFDYENVLEGCRLIPLYEWKYLAGKWEEALKAASEGVEK